MINAFIEQAECETSGALFGQGRHLPLRRVKNPSHPRLVVLTRRTVGLLGGSFLAVVVLLVLDHVDEGVEAGGVGDLQHHVRLLQDEQAVVGVPRGQAVLGHDVLLPVSVGRQGQQAPLARQLLRLGVHRLDVASAEAPARVGAVAERTREGRVGKVLGSCNEKNQTVTTCLQAISL